MSKIVNNNFSIDFSLVNIDKSDLSHHYYQIKMAAFWCGNPVVNDKILNHCISGEEIDDFTLIQYLEEARQTKEPKFWDSFPHGDLSVAIYPETVFPFFDKKDKKHYVLIFTFDESQLCNQSICSPSPITFSMNLSLEEYDKFIEDLKKEYIAIKEAVYGN